MLNILLLMNLGNSLDEHLLSKTFRKAHGVFWGVLSK